MEKQKTISKKISLKGKGLHSGQEVELTFKPAKPDTGYIFRRIDLDNTPELRAIAENVINTARGTTIQENGAQVMTIEHVCAALSGCRIDNVIIEINSPEVPILDGSAKYYVKAIKEAGIVEQESERVYYTLKEKVEFVDEKNGVKILAYPDDHFSVDVHIDFNSKILGCQFAAIDGIDEFEKKISACKTFVFLHELEALAASNLIKGGDLDNALVIVDKQMSKEQLDRLTELFNKPKVEVLPEGYLNNTELSFQNEPARHKLLDVIGDLSLVGMPLKAKIIAYKPGHHANTELAKIIRKQAKKTKSKPQPPAYDPDIPPLFDINEIKKKLPHRPPFLLVDKITSMNEWDVCGIKNVTMNEGFFIGHYP
ncbi:MAG: bifunctional UDP-3-O-[3-hydroxymyristoyl] N-acetylglucosamine deacetylase/3-hydroxyacyl-ACP dehydratase, partial [Bacteroidales bacterium]